jgi:hypothetical protein
MIWLLDIKIMIFIKWKRNCSGMCSAWSGTVAVLSLPVWRCGSSSRTSQQRRPNCRLPTPWPETLRHIPDSSRRFWHRVTKQHTDPTIIATGDSSKSYPCNRPWRPIGLWDVEAPTFSIQSAHRWRWGCQPHAPAALYTQEYSWYSFLLEVESTPGP